MSATWLDIPADHPFGLDNLPYGVFSTEGSAARVGVRIGDWVLDAGAASEQSGMESGDVWLQPSLNSFLAQGRPAWTSAAPGSSSCSRTSPAVTASSRTSCPSTG